MLTFWQKHIKRNVLIPIIAGELLLISVFLFLPKKSFINEKILSGRHLIQSQDTLKTAQNPPEQNEKQEPRSKNHKFVKGYELPQDVVKKLKISDPVANKKSKSDDKKLNEDSKSPDQNNKTTPESSSPKENIAANTGQNEAPVRSMPRLVFEVLPSEGENKFNGKLELSLKINENGQVVDHRILSNSLNCTDCLNSIIQAAYKSKWEPAIVDGKKADFWVEKSYTFN